MAGDSSRVWLPASRIVGELTGEFGNDLTQIVMPVRNVYCRPLCGKTRFLATPSTPV